MADNEQLTLLDIAPTVKISFNDDHIAERASYGHITKTCGVDAHDDSHVIKGRFMLSEIVMGHHTLTSGGYESISIEIYIGTCMPAGVYSTSLFKCRPISVKEIEKSIGSDGNSRKRSMKLRLHHHVLEQLHYRGVSASLVIKRRGSDWFPKAVTVSMPEGVSAAVAYHANKYIKQTFK